MSNLGRLSGHFTAATAGLNYTQKMRRVALDATADSSLRYYRRPNLFSSVSHRGSVGMSVHIGRQTAAVVRETVTYSPTFYFLQRLFAATRGSQEAEPTAAPDYGLSDSRVYTYATSASLSHALTRRGTLALTSGYRHTDLSARASGLVDQRAIDLGGGFQYRMTRGLILRLGYGYRQGSHGYSTGGKVPIVHDLDLGIDYDRPLSLTRRTTVGFRLGSSAHRAPTDEVGAKSLSDPRPRLQYRLLTNAVLNHGFGRTWRASAVYDRTLGLVEGLGAPVSSDGVTVAVGGAFARRIRFDVSAAYTSGETVAASTSRFNTYKGNAQLQFQPNRVWGVRLEYLYYFYDFKQGAQLSPWLPRGLEQASLRASLAMRIPLVGR